MILPPGLLEQVERQTDPTKSGQSFSAAQVAEPLCAVADRVEYRLAAFALWRLGQEADGDLGGGRKSEVAE